MSLVVFLVCVALVAGSGIFFRPGAWYLALAKPSWTPPNWLFGPAWTILYLLIAISGWRVWERAADGAVFVPMAVYGLQLALNAGWSPLFFGLKRPDWAFAELVCLWLAILANIAVFHPIDPVAAWLLAPYFAWVTYAGALNFAVWRLNKAAA